MYRGVVPLFQTPDGSWSFRENAGEVVDHAVLMSRLPEQLLMERQLAKNAVSKAQVGEIARIVARFHRESRPTPEVLRAGSPENQRRAILDNFSVNAGAFDPALHRAVERRARRDLDRLLPMLAERARRGLVVDGHGDLHARNICLTDPPTIFDCIEFNPEFRCGDVAAENSFMVMDLIYRGRPELAGAYLDSYVFDSGDEEQRQLMPMLVSYRAMVRAKVSALAAADADIDDSERAHARESAARHLQLAAAAALSGDRILLIGCGLPGAGKSHLCQALAERSGWPAVSSDRVRKELAGTEPGDRLPADFYSPEFSERTYNEVIRRACANLAQTCAIADANFPSSDLRARAAAAGRDLGARPIVLWAKAPESVVLERLDARAKDDSAASDADVKVYRKLKASFEPPVSSEELPVIEIDGSGQVDGNLNRLLTALLEI